jgi:hypothetical protein
MTLFTTEDAVDAEVNPYQLGLPLRVPRVHCGGEFD